LPRPASSVNRKFGTVAAACHFRYIIRVKFLTRQEQLFLAVVLGLLLTGLAVKAWRTANPPAVATASQPAEP